MPYKKILICIEWYRPAYRAGGPIVSISNLIENLKDLFEFRVYCSNYDLNNELLSEIETDKWSTLERIPIWYSSEKESSISTWKKLLLDFKPDIIYINGIYSIHYNLIPLIYPTGIRKIVSPRGMLHPGALGQKRLKKIIYIQFLQLLRSIKQFNFHATNATEALFIKKIFGKKALVYVAENFPKNFKYSTKSNKIAGELKIVTIALISPMKNYLLILKALYNIKFNVYYQIYGPIKESEYWNLCLDVIKKMPKNIKVSYNGPVEPIQVSSILEQSNVYIQPSKSENYGHAIYEAFSKGVPVITSNSTPWNCLKQKFAGLNVDPESADLEEAINFFCSLNQQDFDKWKEGAYKYAVASVNIEVLKKSYTEMFAS